MINSNYVNTKLNDKLIMCISDFKLNCKKCKFIHTTFFVLYLVQLVVCFQLLMRVSDLLHHTLHRILSRTHPPRQLLSYCLLYFSLLKLPKLLVVCLGFNPLLFAFILELIKLIFYLKLDFILVVTIKPVAVILIYFEVVSIHDHLIHHQILHALHRPLILLHHCAHLLGPIKPQFHCCPLVYFLLNFVFEFIFVFILIDFQDP